jgi:hypothetical protein
MPIGAPRFAGFVFHLTHLVHVNERIQGGSADSGERPDDREPLALKAPGAGGDRTDGPLGICGSRRAHPRQHQCVCGDSRHFFLLMFQLLI